MTPAQTKLYWVEWSAARKAGQLTDADRHVLHLEALGYQKSSRELSNDEFDKILATFRALSHPADLDIQLRQINQERTRLLHRIRDQFACLALFVQDPCKYLAAILHDRFKLSPLPPFPPVQLESLLEDLRADAYTRPRKHASEFGPAGEPITDSELTQIRNTLERCLSSLRRKGHLVSLSASGGEGRGEVAFVELSEHDMCRLAKVACFRPACAECRKAPCSADSLSASPINISREVLAGPATENEPF